MKNLVLSLIKCYKFIFQVFQPRCRFQPSCSSYAYQAIEMHGLLKGFYLTFTRIVRCHPFCNAGFDPVPLPRNKEKKLIKRNS
jgi:putative membrane protein insertion efficiency factor